jgi:hypothetical protein
MAAYGPKSGRLKVLDRVFGEAAAVSFFGIYFFTSNDEMNSRGFYPQ